MSKRLKSVAARVNDYVASVIRTLVLLAAAWLLGFAARHGLEIHASQALLETIGGVTYYITVRAMEHYVDPRFGWLFGLAKKPAYHSPAVTNGLPVTEELDTEA